MNMNSKMKLLFENGTLFDGRKFLDAGNELLVVDGKIERVGRGIEIDPNETEIVDLEGRILAPGLVDLHAHLRDPGYEWREDLESGSRAGAAGGFTTLVAMPNTDPAIDSEALVSYVVNKGKSAPGARVLPAACVSKHRAGVEMAELRTLAAAGAVLFTDDGAPVGSAELLRLALLYTLPECDGTSWPLVMEHAEEPSLFAKGQVHDGRVCAESGLKGIPAASEEIGILRGIALLREVGRGARMHFTHVSSVRGIEAIRQAKREGLNVTCDVTPHHLSLSEEDVIRSGYSAAFKVNPPLRSLNDQKALWDGLADDTVDAIATDHAPYHLDEKDLPFQEATFGIANLECALACVLHERAEKYGHVPLERVLAKMTMLPANLLPAPWNTLGVLEEGRVADLVVIDPQLTRPVDPLAWKSRCRMTPWAGMLKTGWPVATYKEGTPVWKES